MRIVDSKFNGGTLIYGQYDELFDLFLNFQFLACPFVIRRITFDTKYPACQHPWNQHKIKLSLLYKRQPLFKVKL